jgi:cobalamin biosynthesis protein CbiG
MISSPEDKKRIANAIKELSDCMTRIDAEKELMRDIIQVTYENHGLDKKYVRKLAAIYHKQNMNEVKNEYDEVENLYEQLFKE